MPEVSSSVGRSHSGTFNNGGQPPWLPAVTVLVTNLVTKAGPIQGFWCAACRHGLAQSKDTLAPAKTRNCYLTNFLYFTRCGWSASGPFRRFRSSMYAPKFPSYHPHWVLVAEPESQRAVQVLARRKRLRFVGADSSGVLLYAVLP